MRIVLATGNSGKLREMRALLTGHELVAQGEFITREVEETGLSFVENAILKARHACAASGLPAIADDSGLEVDALRGAPGIRSARYAGPGASDQDNVQKLLQALDGEPHRSARFRCVMVAMRHAGDPSPIICEGSWNGSILESPQGQNGFGYDPVFLVPDTNCSAAELAAAEKNARSHRGQALAALQRRLADVTFQ